MYIFNLRQASPMRECQKPRPEKPLYLNNQNFPISSHLNRNLECNLERVCEDSTTIVSANHSFHVHFRFHFHFYSRWSRSRPWIISNLYVEEIWFFVRGCGLNSHWERDFY